MFGQPATIRLVRHLRADTPEVDRGSELVLGMTRPGGNLVGALLAVAAISRAPGILLVLPILLLYVQRDGWRPTRDWLPLLLAPVALALYLGYLGWLTGDFLAPIHAQVHWDAFGGSVEAAMAETGATIDQAWLDKVRQAAVRLSVGCSASVVSPDGLVATNHHCVRGRVSQVSRDGEGLLDNGFYAASTEEERRIPGYYADQLIAAVDVSEEVFEARIASSAQSGSAAFQKSTFTCRFS